MDRDLSFFICDVIEKDQVCDANEEEIVLTSRAHRLY